MTAVRSSPTIALLWAVLALVIGIGGSAALSYAIVSTLEGDEDKPRGPGIVAPAAVSVLAPAEPGVAGAGIAIYADDAPRIAFSESSGIPDSGEAPSSRAGSAGRSSTSVPSSSGSSSTSAPAGTSSPATSNTATATVPGSAAPTPPAAGSATASVSATRPARSTTPVAPGLSRSGASAIVPIDPCLLRSAVASCPPGIFGRITGGPESPPPAEAPAAGGLDIDLVRRLLRRTAILEFLGRTESASDTGSSSATLESSTLVLTKALITPAEVREGAGVRDCTSPTASTVSFLVGTTESQYVMVHYWQAARGSGEPAPLAVRNASAVTSTLIDRPPGPPHYESCLTLDALRVGITYEARVQTVTRGGSAEWSPIGSFCLAPCLPSFRIPAGTLSGERLELHAWGAYVSLPSTPASGSLEFFVRAAGCCDTWHFSTILSNYEPGQKLASHPIYPGLEFEYRLVLHGNDGRDYESGIGLFTTLRRKLFLQVSQFDVITDGDSGSVGEFTDMFVSLTTYGGECPAGASVCSARRTFNEIAVPLGGLDGDSPLNEGSIDVTQGTTIGVAPRIDFVLDGHGHHTYLLVTLVHEDDSPSITQPYDNGLYSIEFHVPQGIGAPGSSALKSGEVCALPNSSFSVLDRAAYLNGWYEGSSRGPWVQPSDAFVCVVEFP